MSKLEIRYIIARFLARDEKPCVERISRFLHQSSELRVPYSVLRREYGKVKQHLPTSYLQKGSQQCHMAKTRYSHCLPDEEGMTQTRPFSDELSIV
jgi:hypothetical protein